MPYTYHEGGITTADIAHRDADRVTTLLATSNADNLSTVNLWADPSTHSLLISGSITASPASVGTTGAAVPASADYVGGNKSGNLTGLLIGSQTGANSLAVVVASDQVLSTRLQDGTGTLITSTSQALDVNFKSSSASLGVLINNSAGSPGNVNVSQINGVTTLMGNGTTGTGSQRVTIASDNTPFPVKIDQTTPGTTNLVSVGTLTNKITYGTYTAMTVTNLQSIASSATAGWQSARVDNQTSVKALDYEVFVKLTTANTAPANDKAAYVYVCPMITTDGGTTWLASDQGTTTLPTGTEGTTTIASPNNLKLLGILNYTTQQMVMQGRFNLSDTIGLSMPDGFSIIIINFTGAALSTSCVVAYRAINVTQS